MAIENVSRRTFLGAVGLGGTGLVLGLTMAPRFGAAAAANDVFSPSVYLSIDPTGLVTIVSHRTEMGQGIRTSTSMVVADELEADWARIRVVQADGDKNTAARIRMDRTASVTSCSRFARRARPRARCSSRPRQAPGRCRVNEVHARNHEVVHEKSGRDPRLWGADTSRRRAARSSRDLAHAQDQGAVPLYRQARTDRRWRRHRPGQGRIRLRRETARHEVRASSRARRCTAAR